MAGPTDGWTRRGVLGAGAAAAAVGCGPGEADVPLRGGTGQPSSADTGDVGSEVRRPNVLLLFPDQWRAQSLRHRGDPNADTPVLDAFAAESVSFVEAITPSAVCTPARAAMLTGQMPWATGMSENGARLPDGTPTLGTALRNLGYRCGWVGKWHLEGEGTSGFVAPERRFGFRDGWAAHNFHHRYLQPELFFETPVPVRPDDGRWQPSWETDLAMAALTDAAGRDEPFFLTVSWGPPHPNQASPSDWSLDVPRDLLDSVDPDRLVLRPNVPLERVAPTERDPWGIRGFLQGYYACIRGMDAEVGRILDHLEALGLADDTLVIFTSDHGEMGGSHGLYKKGVWFEEAIRVPLLCRWPAGFAGGRTYRTGASLLDLVPTLLALAGAAPPEGLHGRDLSPWLLGLAPDDASAVGFGRKEAGALAWRGVRTATHKLCAMADGSATLLYDLVDDPYEVANRADDPALAEVRAALEAELALWRDRTDDPLG